MVTLYDFVNMIFIVRTCLHSITPVSIADVNCPPPPPPPPPIFPAAPPPPPPGEIPQKRKRELEKEQHRIVDGMGMSF